MGYWTDRAAQVLAEARPSLADLRKKKKAKGGKPWTMHDVDDYEYQGKRGKWRTSKSGDRLFVVDNPGEGEPEVLGIAKPKLDAMRGQRSLFGPKKKKRSNPLMKWPQG